MNKLLEPNWSASVLITIDIQNDFSLPGAAAEVRGIYEVVGKMVQVVNRFRQQQLPIIHVIRLYKEDGSMIDDAVSGVYSKGLEELAHIGVKLMSTEGLLKTL